MNRKATKTFLLVAALVVLTQVTTSAQGINNWGENTDIWSPTKQQGWIADSLFMGASFLRDTAKDFKVWFHFNEAGCTGLLSLMVPGGRSNGGDTAIALFSNKVTRGTTVDFTQPQFAWVHNHIKHMDTIFFRYQVYDGGCGRNPRYTGPSRKPGDLSTNGTPWTASDRYWNIDSVGNLVSRPDGTTFPIHRRWCAAGWIRDDALQARTDTVEFGFEDLTPGDKDFDDIIFHVTGVFLIRPAVVSNIRLDAEPAVATIFAGDSVTYTATVLIDSTDTLGNHYHDIPDLIRSNRVRWSLVGDSAAVLGGVLVYGPGPRRSNVFKGFRAYKTYTIMATIVDDVTGQIVSNTIKVTVLPNVAASLIIEGAPDTLSGLDKNVPNPVNSITLPSAVTKDTVYAILRDAWGNLVSPCQTTDWNVISGSTIISATAGNAAQGQGIVTKIGPAGIAQVTAKDRTKSALSFTDTVSVQVDPASYTHLRFVVGSGGQKRVISTLEINMNADTLLKAEARREDRLGGEANDGWVSLNVGWSMQNLVSSVPPPSSGSQWRITPADTGSGVVTIRFGTLVSNLPVRVISSGPRRLELYARPGAPGVSNSPYFSPSDFTYTRQAGNPMPLVGKVFDAYNVWLSQYETNPTLSAQISWEARLASNGTIATAAQGEISVVNGHATTFTGKRSGVPFLLIATFANGESVYRDTIRILVTAGRIDHLVIEPTPDTLQSPNQDNRLGQIEIPNTATSVDAYAMLRDIYGNFVAYADSTAWISRNLTIVNAQAGNEPLLGEGTITRVTASNNATWVVAQRGEMIDSVRVLINSVTYDAIQIYVLDGGVKTISSLVLRTDQDTTLYARGKRSDNGQWVDVPVSWSGTTLSLVPSAPSSAASWSFEATSTGSGRIIASRSGTSGTVADTVQVTINPGLPAKLRLYARGASEPLPSNEITGTLVAGRDTVMVARLFDHNDIPLPAPLQYSWSTALISGSAPAGVLTIRSNDTAAFASSAAFKTVDITVTYPTGEAPLRATARFRIVADTASQLVIEPSPTPSGRKLFESDPLTSAEIQATDTVTYAYAVLRDRFGNFVSPVQAADWRSVNTEIVDVFRGVVANGEGVIVRRGRNGSTLVIAQDSNRPFLIDTLPVSITISYDSLRIVIDNNGLVEIGQITMRTDQDTTLFVQGKRSDNGRWEYVQARWSTSAGLTLSPAPPLSASIYTFHPADTGHGYLAVSLGNSVPDTIRLTFQPGLPCKVELYPRLGRPGGSNAPYSPSSQAVIARAGIIDTLVAKVFDCNGVWLDWYEDTSSFFSWTMQEQSGQPPSGLLQAQNGAMATFLPYRAQNRSLAIVAFTDGARSFTDSVLFSITAGIPDHLVLEASQNPDVSPFSDNPVDTITMTKNMDYSRVYAILRDVYQNWVGYSTLNDWESLDTAFVTAEDGNSVVGEGIISRTLDRNTAGSVQVAVTSLQSPELTDTVVVKLLNISYDSIKIVVRLPNADNQIDSLIMTTNDDTTLIALGLRSDTEAWEPVQVRWNASAHISATPSAPELATSWRFSPDSPVASGLIWIETEDTATVNDTIAVRFDRGAPLSASIEILTPAQDLIAGQTITAVVRVRNRDGAVPGEWCFSGDSAAIYRDRLGHGGLDSLPKITIDNTTANLNVNNTAVYTSDQCFTDGVDTISFVLYYAPKDSLHQLSVLLGSMIARSAEFALKPAEAQRVEIVDRRDGKPVGDTLILNFPNDAILLEVRGYDRFGNPTGAQQSLWETSGPIPPASPSVSTSVYYTVASAQDNVSGTLQVTSLLTPLALRDSVVIRVVGFYPEVTSITTRDNNGNGYLDRLEVTFSNTVTIDDTWVDRFAVEMGEYPFEIDSIGYGPDKSTVFVYLHEKMVNDDGTRAAPQTNWRPQVTIDLFEGALDTTFTAADGAGPVIWEVTKKMKSAVDRSQDRVVVTFSEPILTNNTKPGSMYRPEDLFLVWEKDPISGELRLVSGLFDGIEAMLQPRNDSTLEFAMANGLDLKTRNYISINTATEIITDNASSSGQQNSPNVNNRPVSVVLVTPPPEPALIYPNPALPALRNGAYPPGTFSFVHEEAARSWARSGSGVVLSFTIPQAQPGEQIKGHIKIYDVSGNLVATSATDDLLEKFTEGLSAYDIDVFWNGTNALGMPVAPGVYRYIIYLDYQRQDANDVRLYGNIGIRR